MSLTSIQNIHTEKGYDDFIGFLNNELTTPSSGVHTAMVDFIVSTVNSNDYVCFLGELYTDSNDYYGCFVVDSQERLLVIKDKSVLYTNVNSGQVATLFNVLSAKGLSTFFSGRINLYNKAGSIIADKEFEINGASEFGDDIYYTYIVDTNERTHTGRISGQELENQDLGSYNIKIDKLSIDSITLIGQRNRHTTFTVRISENVVKTLSYDYIGTVLYVQDTTTSRESIRRLEREGVISSNL